MRSLDEINQLLAEAEANLASLNCRQAELLRQIAQLQEEKASLTYGQATPLPPGEPPPVTNQSPHETRIALFRSLFRGRDDIYAMRFENLKTGKTGYSPACRNPRAAKMEDRQFLPLTDEVVRNHLQGIDPHDKSRREFAIGVFPMLSDETCCFLAADFDKAAWANDTRAFLETCKHFQVPATLERSRSGNGGHIWIFFAEPVPAVVARKMGAFLLTQTLDRRPEIGLDSYDRFFPSQDKLPTGGFGNLIAPPFQQKPRANGNSLFLDENFVSYQDQWAFLSSVRRMSRQEVEAIAGEADKQGDLGGVRIPITDANDDQPWAALPSRRPSDSPIVGPLPQHIDLVLSNQVYVPKTDLTPSMRNRLISLAAFQNPEFYKAQAMRLSTFGKPRIIPCCEDFPNHLALPRGCLDEVLNLFQSLKVEVKLVDERYAGTLVDLQFHGVLRRDQQYAAEALLQHDTGVLSASTAFGKTVVATYLVAQRKVNTLIVVHGRQLLDQWVEALSRFLGLTSKEIGQIGGGKRKPTEKIDAAMVQSLCRKGIVDDIVGNYGYVIVDECHHIPAVTFEQVVRQSKARYLTGLSATVVRKDGHHPIILMQCGPVRYRVGDRKQAQERPFDHKAIIRPTSFHLPSYLHNMTPAADPRCVCHARPGRGT